jgi:S-formylglutathione hydrolase
MSTTPKEINATQTFDGVLTQYTHTSNTVNTPMRFSIFCPNTAKAEKPAHVLFWLSGLTCTDENFCIKAQPAFKAASETNMVIVICDTSPRGANCPGDKDAWDFGEGAGFYLNAKTAEFEKYYNMYDYVTIELYNVIKTLLGSLISDKRSISGHSMGGLGALNLYMKSGLYTSCSAFAPISNPINCPWGKKAFTGYLGDENSNKELWESYDPTFLIQNSNNFDKTKPILIEQGLDDKFYIEKQLLPENLLSAAKDAGVEIIYNSHEGLDHSYVFVSKFIEKHINWHAEQLSRG